MYVVSISTKKQPASVSDKDTARIKSRTIHQCSEDISNWTYCHALVADD